MDSLAKRLLIFAIFAIFTSPLIAQKTTLRSDSNQFWEAARAVAFGSEITIEEVSLDPFQPTQTLNLKRFAVFTSDAKILVHTGDGTEELLPPKNAYFQGELEGNSNSRVVLSVLENGTTRGIISDRGRFWILGGGRDSGGSDQGFAAAEVDAADLEFLARPMQCESDDLSGERIAIGGPEQIVTPPTNVAGSSYNAATYNARIAIESDHEFYLKFGNATDASNYAADLIAFASTVYSADIDTALTIGQISLWSTSSDPWSQTSTTCGLFEFGRYWNNNNTAIDRTIAHFLSGKNNGGGVAWVGVLCDQAFSYNHQGACPSLTPQTSNYGGDYGYSGDLDGNFNINNPSVVWDVVVTSHEMGHNFNSPHTHCYSNVGGNANPIDNCYSGQCGQTGCYCGSTGLPCGTPGQGCGTIMSYCHLLSGGISNISMSFGVGHPHGTAPERVATRMSAAVVSAHNSQPNCLPLNQSLGELYEQWPSMVSVLDMVAFISP